MPLPPIRADRASPNHDPRPEGAAIDTLVLHYTGMETAGAALARLTDPAAKGSAHYLIDEDGAVFALVAEDRRAWHAGVSRWRGQDDVNSRSIGIELVNPGHEFGYRDFPPRQTTPLATCAGHLARTRFRRATSSPIPTSRRPASRTRANASPGRLSPAWGSAFSPPPRRCRTGGWPGPPRRSPASAMTPPTFTPRSPPSSGISDRNGWTACPTAKARKSSPGC
jgi:hypothetical protein